VLRRLHDLLKPGGVFAAHEYSVRDSRRATAIWNLVSTTVIIPAGRIRTGDAGLYRYLRRSVNDYDGAARFRNRLRDNGFTDVHSISVPGWQNGIVHTFLGRAAA
jgi:ubiquinone/menaquinone biosynthesis C-methylase UbiE